MLDLINISIVLYLLPVFLISQFFYTYLKNPLRRIPAAHPLSHFTSLWSHWVRWKGIENATLKEAHARLGPIVCLGPNEISVNCIKGGIKEVYAGGFEKGDGKYNWYSFFSNYQGVDNMFSIAGNKAHSSQKRMISNVYSKSVVTSSPALLAQTSSILYNRFLPYLANVCYLEQDAGVFNIYALLSATTMDIVSGYIFGLAAGSDLISHPKQLNWFLGLYTSRLSFSFWSQEFPRLTAVLQDWFGYRLSPDWVEEANRKIEQWTENMCEGAARVLLQSEVKPEDTPVVYQQLTSALSKEAKKAGKKEEDSTYIVASEVLDHLAAGFDTSGITLTYVIHELSKHPDIQSRLQTELLTLNPPLVPSTAPALPDPKAVDTLPFLHAVVWETLRLHSAIPGPQPRFTPYQGCRLGPEEQNYFVPGGVRVSASAGLLHLNEEVYERAEEWRPERWLEDVDEEKRKDMESRWFWAFGSGGRMCVGSHLAVYQMKYIITALYSNYTTTIVNDTDIEQTDSYTAPPKSDTLVIKLEHVRTA